MKVLLDECIPRKLKHSFAHHECRTVPEVGMAGLKNGALLALAEQRGFDVFVTMDHGIEYEQNLAGRAIAIIIIRAKSNQLADLLPHVPDCLAELQSAHPGLVVRVGG